ncbi:MULTISPECIES: hypothetical protein [unclassified Glutamicibacter]|uniref:hypothetical protein n=1 Tax=unclassified Glutamicibacter TaxID=2627139 RepID=UPI002FC601B6
MHRNLFHVAELFSLDPCSFAHGRGKLAPLGMNQNPGNGWCRKRYVRAGTAQEPGKRSGG